MTIMATDRTIVTVDGQQDLGVAKITQPKMAP